ncbi:MAG: hypothetical protein DMF92_05655 [Acidobacteria bacterium]|nr:MAG: hypothetical protein DMF92_05655 [Acidobacteriota bacterium]
MASSSSSLSAFVPFRCTSAATSRNTVRRVAGGKAMRDRARRDGTRGSQTTSPQRVGVQCGGCASTTAEASRSQGVRQPAAAIVSRTISVKGRIKNS